MADLPRLLRGAARRVLRPYGLSRKEIRHLLARLSDLEMRLKEPPYTSKPHLLRTKDPEGRVTIGYAERGAPIPDVYVGFEEVFRGPEPFIRERQRVYVALIGRREPVLDVACGRGEFLDLMREAELRAEGVDLNEEMVNLCRRKGHEVHLADAIDHLAQQQDGSLGAIFSAQFVEHLAYPQLQKFLSLSHSKLSTDGLLLFETVNPHSVSALKTFWVDLTHEKPIFPEVAVALCRLHQFDSAFVIFPHGSGDLERDRWEQGEYAVVASKGPAWAVREGAGTAP